MRTSVILFATDLEDEGYETVVDRVRDMAAADCVTMAANYHHSRDVFPHNPRRKIRFMNGGVFFRPDPKHFAGLRIQPDVADIARDQDPLARLIDVAGKRGLTVKAWTNGVHSTIHASAHPDCAVRNAFGDPYITTLCLTNPDVRAYLRALAANLGQYDLEAYLAESVCFMPFDHGYHHERTLVPISATVKYLLSLCFCPHCVRAAATKGVAMAQLQAFVRDETDHALNGDASALDGVPLTRDAVAALAGGEMAGLLAAREDTVASLIGELAAASGKVPLHVMEWSGGLRAVGGGMAVGGIAGSIYDRAWQDGVDIPRIAALCHGLSVLGYVQDPTVLRNEVADYRAILPPSLPLSVAVRPMPPDCASAGEVAEQLDVLHKAGVASVDYYHYGFMRLSSVAWIGQARNLLDRSETR